LFQVRRYPSNPGLTRGSVVTIGNFDGVHRGHQALLQQLKQKSNSLGLPAVVVSFYPHPGTVFRSDLEPFKLATLRQKVAKLKTLGVDLLYLIRFNRAFSKRSAQNFITEILIDRLRCKALVLGEDTAIGYNRSGDIDFLRKVLPASKIELEVVSFEKFKDSKVSSQEIRRLLKQGELTVANSMLGSPFAIGGVVRTGDKRGRKLGFPTANLYPDGSLLMPKLGVYASKIRIEESNELLGSITNIGVRPTVGGDSLRVETHIFDRNDLDLYDRRIEVQLLDFLRDEEKFAGLNELQTQIELDCLSAREFLGI